MSLHGTDERDGSADGGPRIFNVGFRLAEGELGRWELAKAAPMGERSETTYLWRLGDALARVVVAELPSRRAAEERLLAELEHSMCPGIPDGRERFPDLGEASYWCPDRDGITGSVFFRRGNHVVGVFRADDAPFDAASLGSEVDRRLVQPPAGEVREVPVSGGKPVALIEGLDTAGHQRLQLVADEGDLVREGDAIVFIPPDAGDYIVRVWSA